MSRQRHDDGHGREGQLRSRLSRAPRRRTSLRLPLRPGPSLADDLTQEAFLKAYQTWDTFRGDAPERVWLLRIARNVCLDYSRSPRSRTQKTESLDKAQAEGREPATEATATGKEPPLSVEEAARQSEMTDCVQQFVLSMSETLRTPLILHDMQGLTNAEVAQVLGCSLQAAKMRLHRARTKLREMMDERCDLFHDERNVLSCLPDGARA